VALNVSRIGLNQKLDVVGHVLFNVEMKLDEFLASERKYFIYGYLQSIIHARARKRSDLIKVGPVYGSWREEPPRILNTAEYALALKGAEAKWQEKERAIRNMAVEHPEMFR